MVASVENQTTSFAQSFESIVGRWCVRLDEILHGCHDTFFPPNLQAVIGDAAVEPEPTRQPAGLIAIGAAWPCRPFPVENRAGKTTARNQKSATATFGALGRAGCGGLGFRSELLYLK
jgi:hypothetical protein